MGRISMLNLLSRSYRVRIDLIVVAMRTDELHQHAPITISDVNHEAKLVAADIEDHAIVGDEIDIAPEHLFHIRWPRPLGGRNHAIPRAQRLLRGRMALPELAQRSPRNDLHWQSV